MKRIGFALMVLLVAVAAFGQWEVIGEFGDWTVTESSHLIDGTTRNAYYFFDEPPRGSIALIDAGGNLHMHIEFPMFLGSGISSMWEEELLWMTDEMESIRRTTKPIFLWSERVLTLGWFETLSVMLDLLWASEVVFRTTLSDGRTVDSHFDLVSEDTVAAWLLVAGDGE